MQEIPDLMQRIKANELANNMSLLTKKELFQYLNTISTDNLSCLIVMIESILTYRKHKE